MTGKIIKKGNMMKKTPIKDMAERYNDYTIPKMLVVSGVGVGASLLVMETSMAIITHSTSGKLAKLGMTVGAVAIGAYVGTRAELIADDYYDQMKDTVEAVKEMVKTLKEWDSED